MSSTQVKQIKDRSARPPQSQNGNSDPQSTNKNQPTGEQLRIAQITSSDRSDVDPEMLKKIKEVSDLTGRSPDEAWTALHDCNGDANQAVELLFEKEGEQDEWQEKKKKKKAAVTIRPQTTDAAPLSDTRQERATDGDVDRSENIPRGQQRDRAPPRFQRGRGRGYSHNNANGEKDVSASRERGPEGRFEGGRGRRGGRGGGRGGEGGAGRSRGERGYSSNNAGLETVTHIETWTNETAQNGKNDTAIGAWGDTATEEWTADEWSGSLEESLVLTRSLPTCSDAFPGASSSALDASSSQQPPQPTVQSQTFVPSSHASEALTDGIAAAAGYRSSTLPPTADQSSSRSVGFDLNHLLPKFSEAYSGMTRDDESAYLSHYTKKATECIKNAVGIGSGSNLAGHGVASSGLDQLGRTASQSNSAQQMSLPNRMKPQQQQQMPHAHQQQLPQQQQQRPRLPPPSKIPLSAVEMPGSTGNAQLDVQFGSWEATSSSTATDVSGFLGDASQTSSSQFAGQTVNAQQSAALGLSGKALGGGGGDMSLHKPSGHAMNDSSSSAVHVMQERSIGSKSATAYQTNAAGQTKELGGSNKMAVPPPQLLPFPSSNDDRKTMAYSSQQPSNQLPGQGSLGSSQLGLRQLAYSSGVESVSSVYKPSSAAGCASAYSQTSASQHGASDSAPYGSTLHYQATGPQTMHAAYPVAATTQGAYSAYGVTEQASFSNTPPASYIAMTTQAPTAFSGSTKPYGSVADKPSGSFPSSVLSQVYESGAMGNAYPVINQPGTGIQMGYPSTGTMYPGNQVGVGMSYESLPAVSGGVYQNHANLYRGAGQMSVNSATNDFQAGISESFPRGTQAAATPQASSVPGKLMDGLNKMSVKDSVSSAISQSYDSTTANATTSGLSSAATVSSSAGLVTSSAAGGGGSSLKTSTVATAKSTATSKATMNWPPSGGVPAPMMNVNPNYVIGQPPGFQLATFGYPAQQTLPYAYEDLQILQQRYAMPAAYYDLPMQASSTLPTRDLQASLTSASFVPGSDVKLAAAMEPQVTVAAVQAAQQGPTVAANQQSYSAAAAAAAMHPGYSYYYPPAAGMVPYYTPMIPVGGVAVPMVTNPTHGATTSSTMYQKPTLYGSHAFGAGGQSQDFSKTFNPQASVKATGTTTGMTPNDMIVAGSAFGKSHVQGFDKVLFPSGTPPPTSFSLALGTQGGALGQPAIYGTPYMPMMPQQQQHSQIMHHAMAAQDSSMVGRGGVQPNVVQAKVGSNKVYSNPYWAGGN